MLQPAAVEVVQGQPIASSSTTHGVFSLCEPIIRSYIKVGKKNDTTDVKNLQTFLNSSEKEVLDISGVYDSHTQGAVKRFQQKYKTDVLDYWQEHDATGYVYITTKDKINALACSSQRPVQKCPVFSYAKPGDVGEHVRDIQEFLVDTQKEDLSVSGAYDQKTTDAVKRYQEKWRTSVLFPWGYGLPTGLVLQTTRKQMHRDIGCFEKPTTLPNGKTVN